MFVCLFVLLAWMWLCYNPPQSWGPQSSFGITKKPSMTRCAHLLLFHCFQTMFRPMKQKWLNLEWFLFLDLNKNLNSVILFLLLFILIWVSYEPWVKRKKPTPLIVFFLLLKLKLNFNSIRFHKNSNAHLLAWLASCYWWWF